MSKLILSILVFIFILISFFSTSSFSQSLIINEVSQGPSASKEYVELLVVPGTSPYQCTNYCIDLRGWIIDDNNGYFSGGGGAGLGIAAGAFRFSNNVLWSCVPVGTIIVIYNDLDFITTMPSDDISTSDGNCRLIVPISSNLIEGQTSSPTNLDSNYPANGWIAGGGPWTAIGMANGGDSFQIYNPANQSTPTHGVSWLNNNVNNIIYFATSATNSVYYFANTVDNNPSNQANWFAGTCSAPDNQTPGAPNNAANAAYIQSLTNNCAGPLTATLSSSVDAGSCQCNGSATINATGSIPGYSYSWYSSSNVSLGQTASTASNLCPGNYYCVVSSSINCLDTAFVTINSSTNTILPTFNTIAPICIGGSINLPTTSLNSITGAWSPLPDNTQTTLYTFTPDPNQCASITTLTVLVSNGLAPTFTQISAACEGGIFSLANTSMEGIIGNWSPTLNNISTTTYTFTPDAGQCATISTMTVEINPIPQISINENPTICPGESTTLSTLVDINGGTYLWSPGLQTTDAITINPSSTTTYSVTYEVNGCQSQPASSMATVNPSTSPTFDSYGPFCEDAILAQVILPETSNNGITGTWNPVMLSTNNPGLNNYQFTPDPGQCASVYNLTVEVFSAPAIEAGNNLTICNGSSVQLTASGGLQYSWTSGVQNGQTFQPNQTQTYFVTGSDINGCEATDSIVVTLVSVPIAQFTPDLNIGTAPLSVNFSNTSSNATSFDWNFGDGNEIISADLSNVSNSFLNPGSYTVWLVASNGICADSISDIMIVNAPGEPILSVPNVLTPNGDGSNDEWFIFTQNVAELEVIIINRWGNDITKIEGISGSWNGKTTNGDDVTDGTYFYKYTAKALSGKSFSGNGFITLIR